MKTTLNKIDLAFISTMLVLPIVSVDMPRMWSFIPGILALIYLITVKLFYNVTPKYSLKLLSLQSLILFLGFLSCLWAVSIEESFERSLKLLIVMISGFVFVSAIYTLQSNKYYTRYLILLLPLLLSLASLLVVFELNFDAFSYKLFRGDFDMKVRDHVFNRGAVSITLCFFSALAIVTYARLHVFIKLIFILSTLLLMYFTDSQSAQLAMVLGLITFYAFPIRASVCWYLLIITLTVLIFSAPYLSIWLFNTFAPALDTSLFFSKGYAANRLEIWDYVSRYTFNKPILGYGIEATRAITDFDSNEIYQEGTSILHPHNFALQLRLEFGLLGAIAGAFFCNYLLLKIKNNTNTILQRIMLSTFISTLSVAATGYGMWQSWWIGLIFFSFGLCILSSNALYKNEQNQTINAKY